MSRNRRNNTNSINLTTLIVAGTFIFIVGALAFFYVHQKNRLVFLGNELRKMEQQIQVSREKNEVLAGAVANLKSPRIVNYKNIQWGLGLVQPHDSQFVVFEQTPSSGASSLNVASGTVKATPVRGAIQGQ
ncbi:MAG: hypothetical protein SGI98_09270 [Verrucomicrobiota bacterium]|nr:hypothetical protein [Verrucomicrobiota bacterium]